MGIGTLILHGLLNARGTLEVQGFLVLSDTLVH